MRLLKELFDKRTLHGATLQYVMFIVLFPLIVLFILLGGLIECYTSFRETNKHAAV